MVIPEKQNKKKSERSCCPIGCAKYDKIDKIGSGDFIQMYQYFIFFIDLHFKGICIYLGCKEFRFSHLVSVVRDYNNNNRLMRLPSSARSLKIRLTSARRLSSCFLKTIKILESDKNRNKSEKTFSPKRCSMNDKVTILRLPDTCLTPA